MKKLIFIFICLLSFNMSFSQWSQLSHAALSGYEDRGIIYTGTSVLIATEGGIFRSTDNGSTWQKSNNGLDTNDISINDITYFNNKPWVISSSLYSSNDDGVTWIKNPLTGLPLNTWVHSMAKKGNTLFLVCTYYDNILDMNVHTIYYSIDGNTWTQGHTFAQDNSWWEVFQDNDFALFLSNENQDTIFYTTNGTVINYLPKTGLPTNAQIKSRLFSIEQGGNNFFYLSENTATIYRYNFNTQTWEVKMNGISGQVAVFVIHSLSNIVFTTTYVMSPIPALKLYYSLDTANTWINIPNPGLLFPLFNGTIIRAGNNRLISRDLFTDMYYSDNNGQLWTKNSNIMSLDYATLISLNNGNLLTLRNNYGILKSTDNGTTWAQSNGDLPNFMSMLYFAQDMAYDGNTLFASSAEEPDGDLFMYKSTNNGVNWIKQTTAPDSSDIVLLGFNGGKLFVYFNDGNGNGTYQYTADGSVWTNISPAINVLNLNKVLGFKANNDTLFLFGLNDAFQKRLYISTDNGLNFNYFTNGLDGANVEILIENEWNWEMKPIPVADFGNDNINLTVAAATLNTYPKEVRFYRYDMSQNLWLEISSNGLIINNNTSVHSLQYKEAVWYLTTSIGVFASVDDCLSWERVWNNQGLQLGMRNRTTLLTDNGHIFLGTAGTGIWKTIISQPTFTTNTVTNITGTQAIGGATISNYGGLPFVGKGLCWATHTNPTIFDNSVVSGTSPLSYSDTLTGLTPSTTYYVRACIITNSDTLYGNEQSFSTIALIGAQINPVTADYVLSNPSNLTTTITWNDATVINTIVDNTPYTLSGLDYSVSANTLTINHSYLATNLISAGQSITLTISFDIGTPVTFTITAVQTMINHAEINPSTASYDLIYPSNIQTTITWNDASSIQSIQDNQMTPYTLLAADFILAGNTLTINQSYLATVLTNNGESISLTIQFDIGNPATLQINAIETVIVDAEINPVTAPFYINAPANIKTVITWNDASNITAITDDQTTPYTLTGNDYTINTDSLFINASYLSTVLLNVNDTIRLTIVFDAGNNALFKIYGSTAIGTEENADALSIFPNPVQNNLKLNLTFEKAYLITIYNVNGQKVYEKQHDTKLVNIDVSQFENGIYTLLLRNETQNIYCKFIVIK